MCLSKIHIVLRIGRDRLLAIKGAFPHLQHWKTGKISLFGVSDAKHPGKAVLRPFRDKIRLFNIGTFGSPCQVLNQVKSNCFFAGCAVPGDVLLMITAFGDM